MPYARAAIVRLKRSSDLEEVVQRVSERVAMLRRQPGFISYSAIQTSDNEVIGLTVWQTREQAESASERTDQWNRQQMGSLLESTEAFLGEVLIHQTAPTTP